MQALNKGNAETRTLNKSVSVSSETEFSGGGSKTVVTTVTTIRIKKISKSAEQYTSMQKEQLNEVKDVVCQDWSCEPMGAQCKEKPSCPAGTKIQSKWTGKACPVYECIALPPMEKECHVNGRLIFTFDGLSFTYDLSDHILAEDKMYATWKIQSKLDILSRVYT